MLAYRLVHESKLFHPRSFCPKCKKNLLWYDLIPIFSWFILKAKCRNCKQPISILYPIVEILSLIVFIKLFDHIPFPYFFSYFIFFSALIVTIRTDIETMLISRFVTIFLIPVAFILTILNLLPISLHQSVIGTIVGYLILYLVEKIFFLLTKKQGLGRGDAELLSFIGAFTGVFGCWISLLIGSILGSFFGLSLVITNKLKFSNKIPFGPFLAFGAILFVLYQQEILDYLFRI